MFATKPIQTLPQLNAAHHSQERMAQRSRCHEACVGKVRLLLSEQCCDRIRTRRVNAVSLPSGDARVQFAACQDFPRIKLADGNRCEGFLFGQAQFYHRTTFYNLRAYALSHISRKSRSPVGISRSNIFDQAVLHSFSHRLWLLTLKNFCSGRVWTKAYMGTMAKSDWITGGTARQRNLVGASHLETVSMNV